MKTHSEAKNAGCVKLNRINEKCQVNIRSVILA